MEAPKKVIKSKEGESLEFPDEFGAICEAFANSTEDNPLSYNNISITELKTIHSFYKAFDWKEPQKCVTPLRTNDLQQELGETSFKIMEKFSLRPNIPKLVPLIEAVYEMNLQGLTDHCLTTAAIEFVFEDPEKGLEEYKKKYNVQITKEDEDMYRKEFEEMWEQAAKEAEQEAEIRRKEIEEEERQEQLQEQQQQNNQQQQAIAN